LIVLIDDMGFGASSAFGGPCEMPHAERLAAGGARFNLREPLLWKGNDFGHTGVQSALGE
jgi:uncharacterized protein with PIN domain